MACYIISYDLEGDLDYDPLYEAIKSYRAWAHITESTWAVVSQKNHKEIRDHLSQYLSDSSRLIVAKSGGGAAWHNVICRNKWLKDNL